MKRLLTILAVLALVGSPAFAGPNAGGTLIAHDTGLAYTTDSSEYPSPAPSCDPLTVDNQIGLDVNTVWKAYAAFPLSGSPRLKALPMGATFPGTVVVLTGGLPNPALDFEITQGGWPQTSGGGVGISFGNTQTAYVSECYWFAGYGYGAGGQWSIAPHPSQGMVFVDDSAPPQEDAIVALSSLGFGQAGDTHCPSVPTEVACCFADGSCQLLLPDACVAAGGTVNGAASCDPNPCPPPPPEGACCVGEVCSILREADCLAQGGTWLGPGVTCDPNPCVIPVEETSWGHIKANYR
jgi:hypothetical protein